MRIVVQKYGGSSVADVARLKRVAERVVAKRRAGFHVVVVVSAMGDSTDRLLKMAGEVTDTPGRRELDMLLTVGERTSMALLSMAISGLGEDAISFTGSQCGILTTDDHARARIMEVRPFRVQDELARGRIVIVAGYQGTSYKREITTLGRGGSDLTAVALAGALGAEACEIFSDVDGVLTADPRVVDDATRIETLSFDEMEALSRGGAKVLNRQAIAWARRTSVALYARSTFADESARGTAVRVNPPERHNPVVGVTGRGDLLAVDGSPTIVDPILDGLALAGRVCSRDSARTYLATSDLHEVESLTSRLIGAGAAVTGPVGSVTVVGSGLGEDPNTRSIVARHFGDLPQVLTGLQWTAWLETADVNEMVSALHDDLGLAR